MKSAIYIKRWNLILLNILRFLLVCFVLAAVMGIKFPFASSEKSNFIALIHLGVAVGVVSNWRFIIGLKWKDPINIIGSVLGAAATLVIVFTIRNMKMPVISGYKGAFLALAILLVIKIGLKMIQDRKNRPHDQES